MSAPSLEDLLPHRGPMLLIDAVDWVSPEGCGVRTRVDPSAWYAQEDGSMPAWIGLELMAQAAAVFNGHPNGTGAHPSGQGYLLGTRYFEAYRPSFPAGALLDIEARLEFQGGAGLSSFICGIRWNGIPLASATLNVLGKP